MVDDENGRTHIYKLVYVDISLITGIKKTKWEQKGTQYIQKTIKGVEFSLRPKMSWQIWWKIPLHLLKLRPLSV